MLTSWVFFQFPARCEHPTCCAGLSSLVFSYAFVMQKIPFGSTGLSVAPLGIGSIGAHFGEDVVVRQMNLLLDAGCNLVDTAACYQVIEIIIGRHFSTSAR